MGVDQARLGRNVVQAFLKLLQQLCSTMLVILKVTSIRVFVLKIPQTSAAFYHRHREVS